VIDETHPLVRAAIAQGRAPFISPTTSDMALMYGIPSLKIGPGLSQRSHTADEFVRLNEIEEALCLYPAIIKNIRL
ncbi:MAG: acetylornithine deacetylase, partial [Muribaculaceae bacterium]|nr:acetylornithine deacetylase [Muribaculaceae bacterium]